MYQRFKGITRKIPTGEKGDKVKRYRIKKKRKLVR